MTPELLKKSADSQKELDGIGRNELEIARSNKIMNSQSGFGLVKLIPTQNEIQLKDFKSPAIKIRLEQLLQGLIRKLQSIMWIKSLEGQLNSDRINYPIYLLPILWLSDMSSHPNPKLSGSMDKAC